MAFKYLFIFSLIGFLVGGYRMLSQGEVQSGDIGGLINSLFFLVTLYGYAFKKAIIHRYLAIGMFLWNAVGYLFVTMMFMLLLMSAEGGDFDAFSALFFLAGYSLVTLLMYVMFRYAFKSPDIWNRKAEQASTVSDDN